MVYTAAGRVFLLIAPAAPPETGERVELPDRGQTLVTDLAPTAARPWTLIGTASPGRCAAEAIAAGSIGVVSADAVLGTIGSASAVELRLSGCTASDLERRTLWLGVAGAPADAAFAQLSVTETEGDPAGEHGDVSPVAGTEVRVIRGAFGERPLCAPERLRVDLVRGGEALGSYPGFTVSWVARVGDTSYLPLFDLDGRYRLFRIADNAVTEVGAGGILDPVDVEGCDDPGDSVE
jgi:hypothetical protein